MVRGPESQPAPPNTHHDVPAHGISPSLRERERADAAAPVGTVPASAPLSRHDDVAVPHGVRVAAAWSWRLLVLVAAIAALLFVIERVQLVVVPLVIALLLSALLQPGMARLRRAGVPKSLAAAIMLIGGIAVVSGVLTAVVTAFVNGYPDLADNVEEGIDQIRDWLQTGPLHLSDRQLSDAIDGFSTWVKENRETLTSGAAKTATTAGHVIAGLFLVLFATFFFMRDGRSIWNFLVGVFPGESREHVKAAGEASWSTLVSYVRAQVFVAFIDAVGIGLALLILGVPLALPLAALVFLTAFIPIIGAMLSGAVAVLVALVTQGPVIAILLLAAVIAVQQIESHLLQPLIMGRAVSIHPLAVIVAIATGAVVAGIVGALVSVPLVAVLNTAVRHLIARQRQVAEPPLAPSRRSAE